MSAAREREPLEAALRALNRRDYAVAELCSWLEGKAFDREEIEPVIEELVATGALDDERFARLFSEDKRELQGWGPERIAAGLAERGIEQALIDAYSSVEDYGGQIERARDLLQERGMTLDDERARGRALGLLTRRGYSYDAAYDAIRGLAA